MPYLECPGCRVSLYSAASHSWIDDGCPACGTSLLRSTKRFPSAPGAVTLCHEFPSSPITAANARDAVFELERELGDAVCETAASLVGALVSHSVAHSNAPGAVVELLLYVTPGGVRVEVSDDRERFDVPSERDEEQEWGSGFRLVREHADRWARPSGLRTSVWFELDRAPAGVVGLAPERGEVTA